MSEELENIERSACKIIEAQTGLNSLGYILADQGLCPS